MDAIGTTKPISSKVDFPKGLGQFDVMVDGVPIGNIYWHSPGKWIFQMDDGTKDVFRSLEEAQESVKNEWES